MTADLGFVMNAAERKPDKLSSRRVGDRFSERSFANARRADKTKDRSLRILDQLANGEKFQNAFLDLFQARNDLRSSVFSASLKIVRSLPTASSTER